jgi:hypothetical protein
MNDKISGLIGSSLNGAILTKSYKRPEPINTNGVFDYYGMSKTEQHNDANKVASDNLKKIMSYQPASISGSMSDNNTILDSSFDKLLNQNNIMDVTKVSQNDLFPMILFPPAQQALPTAKVLEGFTFKK